MKDASKISGEPLTLIVPATVTERERSSARHVCSRRKRNQRRIRQSPTWTSSYTIGKTLLQAGRNIFCHPTHHNPPLLIPSTEPHGSALHSKIEDGCVVALVVAISFGVAEVSSLIL